MAQSNNELDKPSIKNAVKGKIKQNSQLMEKHKSGIKYNDSNKTINQNIYACLGIRTQSCGWLLLPVKGFCSTRHFKGAQKSG